MGNRGVADSKKKKLGVWSRTRLGLKHFQKKVLVAWVRFARRHRESNFLPIALFIILFFDGFLVVLPSMIMTGAAVTISPRRWRLFAMIFVASMTLNNFAIYWVGRLIPPDLIWFFIDRMGLETVYESADAALQSYGPWAAFIGASISLPTQMITLMIGMADAQLLNVGKEAGLSIYRLVFLAGLGHFIKMMIFCSIIRFGWEKLEARVMKELNGISQRFQ
ncbi:MAG: hypothetical protein EA369_07875 [Bradymonadales bacterium]|nr:MAG: hypothetical protein EA369_07875 [Bradymonadales bacterium]